MGVVSVLINETLTLLMGSDALDAIMHLTFSSTLRFSEAGGDISDFQSHPDKNRNKAVLIEAVAYVVTERAKMYLNWLSCRGQPSSSSKTLQ